MTELYDVSELTYKICNAGQPYRVAKNGWPRAYIVTIRRVKGNLYYYAQQRLNGKLYLQYIGACGSITPGLVIRAIDALRQKTA
jgi:hypothetical protein